MQKMIYFRGEILLLCVLLWMGGGTPAAGQDNSGAFIRPLAITKDKLKPGQQDKSSRLEKWDKVKKFQYVQLGNLPQLQKKGVLMFSIPGVAGTFTARAKRVEAKSEKDYHWYGEFTDRYGALTIHTKDGQLSGQITTEDQVYEIHALGEDVYALIAVDLSKFTARECATPPNAPASAPAPTPAPGSGRKGDPNARFAGCPAGPARVLVLWTPAALNVMGWNGLNARIDFVMGQTNDAFRGSAVGINIQEAGRAQINFFETGSIWNDVNTLANNPDAQALRDQTAADLVVLMTDGNYDFNSEVARFRRTVILAS
jgi:hypothetical protein